MYESVIQRWMLDQKLPDTWWVSVDGSVRDDQKSLLEVRKIADQNDATILITHSSFQTGGETIWYTFEKDRAPTFSPDLLADSFRNWCNAQKQHWLTSLQEALLPELRTEIEKSIQKEITSVVDRAVNKELPTFLSTTVEQFSKQLGSEVQQLQSQQVESLEALNTTTIAKYEKELAGLKTELQTKTIAHAKDFAEQNFLPKLEPVIQSLWAAELPNLAQKISMQVLAQSEGSFNQFKQAQEDFIKQDLLSKAQQQIKEQVASSLDQIISTQLAKIAPELSDQLFAKVQKEIDQQQSELKKAVNKFSKAPPWQSAEPPVRTAKN